MKRQIINIDLKKCNGCGQCIPGCPEGALQIIDGKARLASDLFCDGLGACLGSCPQGAITTIEREAQEYDEALVMQNIAAQGTNTIKAHLKHLKDHGQTAYYQQALSYLKQHNLPVPQLDETPAACCPGSAAKVLKPAAKPATGGQVQSQLNQWPVQLHLINPVAPYLDNADLLICADCVPFAFGDFHNRFLKGKVVITLCPKLDQGIDSYIEKLAAIFATKNINSLHLVRMQVPCCGGIERIVSMAMQKAGVNIMARVNIITIDGKLA